MTHQDLNKEVDRIIDNVKFMDDAIQKAWDEKYNKNLSPSENFVQGFLSGCRFANNYIMEEFRKTEEI